MLKNLTIWFYRTIGYLLNLIAFCLGMRFAWVVYVLTCDDIFPLIPLAQNLIYGVLAVLLWVVGNKILDAVEG